MAAETTYRYRALNGAGRTLRGNLSAQSEEDLYYRLRQIGLDLVTARPVRESKLAAVFARPISTRNLIELCIHLEQLERVGVPILDSLGDMREATESVRLRDVLAEIVRDVGDGKMLSEAFGKHPRIFDDVFVGLISAGERTGNMAESFAHLVRHMKWQERMNQRVKKATRYPAFILLVTIGMMAAMMLYLVPQLTGFLATIGRELPIQTVALIAFSDFCINYWWALLPTPVLAFVAIKLTHMTSPTAAWWMDYWMYRIPVLGPLMKKMALSRFAHFFAVMFQSGIPILECIDTARKVVANRALAGSIALVREMVEGGSGLTDALIASGEFPGLVIRMVRIGEETGALKETLDNVTYFYDRDVEESVDTLIGMIQPALTMIMGGLMIWIITATLGPVYDSFSHLDI